MQSALPGASSEALPLRTISCAIAFLGPLWVRLMCSRDPFSPCIHILNRHTSDLFPQPFSPLSFFSHGRVMKAGAILDVAILDVSWGWYVGVIAVNELGVGHLLVLFAWASGPACWMTFTWGGTAAPPARPYYLVMMSSSGCVLVWDPISRTALLLGASSIQEAFL